MADWSAHVQERQGKRRGVFYIKWRSPDGRDGRKRLGKVWTERSRPPAGYLTRKMAEARKDELLVDFRRGTVPGPSRRSGKTFADAVAEWLRYLKEEQGRKASTLRDYRNTAQGLLTREFGADTPLERITDERIDAFRARLLGEGRLSRRTVQKHMTYLYGIFKRAARLKWVRENPCASVEPVRPPRTDEFNVLSVEQVAAVARAADHRLYSSAITVAAYTGLRTGELRALRWRDVDFAAGLVRVQVNLPVGGEYGTTKSGRGRSTPMMDDAARELENLSRRGYATGPDNPVFCHEDGRQLGPDTLRFALYRAMEAAGIDREAFPAKGGFTFHDLRHMFGTLAVQVPEWTVPDVQAYMGHREIETTMRYVHHIPKHNAARQFSEFVRNQAALAAEFSTDAGDTMGTKLVPASSDLAQ